MSDVENKEGGEGLIDLETLDTAVEEITAEETVESVKAKLEKANAKLKQFPNVIARAKAAEGKVKSLVVPPIKNEEKKPDAEFAGLKTTVDSLALAEKKRQFGYENSLSPAETDAVFRINPNPTKETLKDPFVEGGLAKLKSMKRVEENTPGSHPRSGRVPLKVKADATPEEKQAAFEGKIKEMTTGRN